MYRIHGGDIYQKNIRLDFSVNVSPLGIPEGCKMAIEALLNSKPAYPDIYSRELTHSLVERLAINPDYLIWGNGAAELIYALVHGMTIKMNEAGGRRLKALVVAPTFTEYGAAVEANGGEVVYCNLGLIPEPCDRICSYITSDIDIVFICNPNNPTGHLFDRDELRKVHNRCLELGTYLCVDECFMPFREDWRKYSLLEDVNRGGLIVVGAFTKIYALAGIRLGYMIMSDKELIGNMHKLMQPWNVSAIAQAAGVAAIMDTDYLTRVRHLIMEEKEYLYYELCKLKNYSGFFEVYPSEANFILFCAETGLAEKLEEDGVLIRECSDFYGLEPGQVYGKESGQNIDELVSAAYYRVAVLDHDSNVILIERLKDILDR